MSRTKLATTLGTLTLLMAGWAVPLSGAAHSFEEPQNEVKTLVALAPIRFREDRGAGLLVNGWINDAGPFTFAIDTGAGVSLVTSRVAADAKLRVTNSSRTLIGGLSSSPITSNHEAYASRVSLGSNVNTVPTKPLLAIVNTLPGNIDGILDPADLFARMAYSIDFPNRQLLVFDARANGLQLSHVPKDGAVVRWVGGNRPFVKLSDGRLVLIDTGSGFGLAVNQANTSAGRNHSSRNVSDLGGGSTQSLKLAPTTVSVGSLELRGVPTDLLVGVPPGTPTLLGRRALYPFKITFDPVARLIAFEPTLRN